MDVYAFNIGICSLVEAPGFSQASGGNSVLANISRSSIFIQSFADNLALRFSGVWESNCIQHSMPPSIGLIYLDCSLETEGVQMHFWSREPVGFLKIYCAAVECSWLCCCLGMMIRADETRKWDDDHILRAYDPSCMDVQIPPGQIVAGAWLRGRIRFKSRTATFLLSSCYSTTLNHRTQWLNGMIIARKTLYRMDLTMVWLFSENNGAKPWERMPMAQSMVRMDAHSEIIITTIASWQTPWASPFLLLLHYVKQPDNSVCWHDLCSTITQVIWILTAWACSGNNGG